MVEAGKAPVTLDWLATAAHTANVEFNKQFVFNMNLACRVPHQLNEDQQKKLIETTLSELKKACNPSEAFETLRAQFKNLPYAPNANNENGETKKAEQNRNPADNTLPVDTVADQSATAEATQEISQ